jgi:hypothetical protein
VNDAELIAAASPIIANNGWAYYFAPATLARGGELGLDPLQFYVLGRGGVLGDVEASVVRSAFGYFNPAVIEKAWNAGRQVLAPREAGREYLACCALHGRNRLSGIEGLDEFNAAAAAVNDAADPTGLALYAAFKAEPLVDDAAGRAMQLLATLREFRGSAHLIALRAVGVESKTAHFVKRPNDIKMFGWTEADAPEITDDTHAAMREAEALTDRIVAPAYSVLDAEQRRHLVDGLGRLHTVLSAG